MFQKFWEIFNGMPGTPQKKSARRRRPIKSVLLTSPKNVLYLRETGRSMRMRKTRRKKHKKWQQSPQKETTAKRTQPKRAARFNEVITVVVEWRCKHLRDLHAEFAAKLTRNSSIECNKCQKQFEVHQHDTKLFCVPKLGLRRRFYFWGGTTIF